MFICKLTLPSDPESTTPDNGRVFCITKLTHVCRRWRLVLTSSPVLWTSFHIVKTAPKFIAECLQRSGTSPIHVSFKWDSSDPDYNSPSTSVYDDDGSVASDDGEVVDDDGNVASEDCINEISSSEPGDSDDGTSSHSTLSVYPDHRDAGYSWTAYIKEAQGYHHLMQHSHRIATLDISLPAPGDDEGEEEDNSLACGLLFYPFPALQTLKLRCFRGSYGSIPKVILDEHIATVNNLLLENIPPTQIVDLSLNLTSLSLRTTGHDTPIDTSSFLRFLEKNPNLRSLTLDNYNFLPTPNSTIPLTLSNLRQLDVLSDSVTFLRHLVALPLGPQSSFRMGRMRRRLSFSGRKQHIRDLRLSFVPRTEHPSRPRRVPIADFRGFWFWLGRSDSAGCRDPRRRMGARVRGPVPRSPDQTRRSFRGMLLRSGGSVVRLSCSLQGTLSKA
jgi:hypothetical protein